MKFIIGIEQIEFSVPASYPYERRSELIQTSDKTASGITHVEDFSVQTNELGVNFEDMPEADYLLLLDWHVNKAEGMLNLFTMVDDLGDSYLVRFISSELKGRLNQSNRYSVSFWVEEVI